MSHHKDYVKDEGDEIISLNTLEGWSLSSNATVNVGLEEINNTETPTLIFSTAQNQNSNITHIINHKFTEDTIRISIYLPEEKFTSTVELYLSSTTNFSKFMLKSWSGFHLTGWNTITLLKSDFNAVNGETFDNTMIRCKIAIYGNKDYPVTTKIHSFKSGTKTIPTVVFTFDDGIKSAFIEGYPYMQRRGLKGTFYVAPYVLGEETNMSLEDCQTAYANGWDISNHTYNHVSLLTLDKDEAINEITQCRDWLIENNMPRGANHLAYPGGNYDSTVIEAAIEAGCLTSRTVKSGLQTTPVSSCQEVLCKILYNTTSLETAKGWVDDAISRGSTLVFGFHHLEDEPSNYVSWPISDFKLLVDYVISKGVLVKTMSEWYLGLLNTPKLLLGSVFVTEY